MDEHTNESIKHNNTIKLMANYESKARTNYFKVKHATRFAMWAKRFSCELVRDSKDPDLVAILFDDSGIPDGYHAKTKHVAHAVKVDGQVWQVRVPNRNKDASKWFTVCDCYINPMTGEQKETAIKIAQLLNGD